MQALSVGSESMNHSLQWSGGVHDPKIEPQEVELLVASKIQLTSRKYGPVEVDGFELGQVEL